MNDLIMVFEQEGRPVTTSRIIAEQFGKQHKNVIRDIENIINGLKNEPVGEEFNASNFGLVSYTDLKGEERPMYLLTKDGFTLLVMGYTGAKAMQFKIAYINAFNRMETALKGGLSSIALQGIEQRLLTLEGTAAQGQAQAENSIAVSYLKAIKKALDSGEYYLLPKGKKKSEKSYTGIFLGVYDEFCYYLFSSMAYQIYADSTDTPLNNKAVYAILANNGVIKKEGTMATPVRRIKGIEKHCIVIYKNKAKGLL